MEDKCLPNIKSTCYIYILYYFKNFRENIVDLRLNQRIRLLKKILNERYSIGKLKNNRYVAQKIQIRQLLFLKIIFFLQIGGQSIYLYIILTKDLKDKAQMQPLSSRRQSFTKTIAKAGLNCAICYLKLKKIYQHLHKTQDVLRSMAKQLQLNQELQITCCASIGTINVKEYCQITRQFPNKNTNKGTRNNFQDYERQKKQQQKKQQQKLLYLFNMQKSYENLQWYKVNKLQFKTKPKEKQLNKQKKIILDKNNQFIIPKTLLTSQGNQFTGKFEIHYKICESYKDPNKLRQMPPLQSLNGPIVSYSMKAFQILDENGHMLFTNQPIKNTEKIPQNYDIQYLKNYKFFQYDPIQDAWVEKQSIQVNQEQRTISYNIPAIKKERFEKLRQNIGKFGINKKQRQRKQLLMSMNETLDYKLAYREDLAKGASYVWNRGVPSILDQWNPYKQRTNFKTLDQLAKEKTIQIIQTIDMIQEIGKENLMTYYTKNLRQKFQKQYLSQFDYNWLLLKYIKEFKFYTIKIKGKTVLEDLLKLQFLQKCQDSRFIKNNPNFAIIIEITHPFVKITKRFIQIHSNFVNKSQSQQIRTQLFNTISQWYPTLKPTILCQNSNFVNKSQSQQIRTQLFNTISQWYPTLKPTILCQRQPISQIEIDFQENLLNELAHQLFQIQTKKYISIEISKYLAYYLAQFRSFENEVNNRKQIIRQNQLKQLQIPLTILGAQIIDQEQKYQKLLEKQLHSYIPTKCSEELPSNIKYQMETFMQEDMQQLDKYIVFYQKRGLYVYDIAKFKLDIQIVIKNLYAQLASKLRVMVSNRFQYEKFEVKSFSSIKELQEQFNSWKDSIFQEKNLRKKVEQLQTLSSLRGGGGYTDDDIKQKFQQLQKKIGLKQLNANQTYICNIDTTLRNISSLQPPRKVTLKINQLKSKFVLLPKFEIQDPQLKKLQQQKVQLTQKLKEIQKKNQNLQKITSQFKEQHKQQAINNQQIQKLQSMIDSYQSAQLNSLDQLASQFQKNKQTIKEVTNVLNKKNQVQQKKQEFLNLISNISQQQPDKQKENAKILKNQLITKNRQFIQQSKNLIKYSINIANPEIKAITDQIQNFLNFMDEIKEKQKDLTINGPQQDKIINDCIKKTIQDSNLQKQQKKQLAQAIDIKLPSSSILKNIQKSFNKALLSEIVKDNMLKQRQKSQKSKHKAKPKAEDIIKKIEQKGEQLRSSLKKVHADLEHQKNRFIAKYTEDEAKKIVQQEEIKQSESESLEN